MNTRLRLILLTLLVVIETLSFSYFRDSINMQVLTWSFLLSGLGIGVLALIPPKGTLSPGLPGNTKFKNDFVLVSVTALCSFIIAKSVNIIETSKVGDFADMMTFIQTQCTLCLNGDFPYKKMPILWGQASPYLPMYWMPFMPLQASKTDIRYLLVAFYTGGMLILGSMLLKGLRAHFVFILMSLCGLFLLINWCMVRDWLFMACTEESVAVFYYLFLGWALLKRNGILLGLAIAFCILSRYVLVAWIPCFLLFTYLFDNKKLVIHTFITCTVFVTGVFIIPYFIRDPQFFLHIPEQYSAVIGSHWPLYHNTFINHLGVIKYYSINQHELAHRISVFAGLFTPLIVFGILTFIRFRKIAFNKPASGIGTLKILMSVFYFFIEIPEDYLLYVPVFFSYLILFHAFRQSYYEDTADSKNYVAFSSATAIQDIPVNSPIKPHRELPQ